VLLVAGDEGEVMDVFVKIGERKFNGRAAPFVKERQVALFLRLQVVQGNPREIGDNDVARNFITAGWVIGQIADVLKGLSLGLAKVFAE
jgi:hypothetical protein